MLYRIRIDGVSPIIMHSGAGIDRFLPINVQRQEITSRRGSNRTATDEARLRELETIASLWLDHEDKPTIPPSAIRAVVETGARKLTQGPQVREGLMVTDSSFEYDRERYGGSIDQLSRPEAEGGVQFTVPVVVQRKRITRTRAKFDLPWSCTFKLDVDDELVDEAKLRSWLDIGGRRIGLGDWRPEKSGTFGRFKLASIETLS